MKIKSNLRAGKNGNSGGGGGSGGSKSKSANSIVTYISELAYLYVNRCSGV